MAFAHPTTGIFETLEAAVAFADGFIAESNGAAFNGIPATSYEIFAEDGLYGTTYEVAFTAPFAVVAGAVFAAA